MRKPENMSLWGQGNREVMGQEIADLTQPEISLKSGPAYRG